MMATNKTKQKIIIIFMFSILMYNVSAINITNGTVFSPLGSNVNYLIPDPWMLASTISVGELCFNLTNISHPSPTFLITNGSNITNCLQSDVEINITLGSGSLLINIFDADNLTSLNFINVTADLDKEGFATITSTSDSGSITFSTLDADTYRVKVSASGYGDRIYFVTTTQIGITTLNAYLILSTATNDVTFIVRDFDDGQFVQDVIVNLQRKIGASFITIAQKRTDFVGSALFDMEVAQEYQMIFTNELYLTRTIFVEIEPTDTEFELLLTKNVSTEFTSLFDNVFYTFSPLTSILEPLNNSNFTFTVVSTDGTLDWFSISSDFNGTNTTNISGIPAGGTAIIQKDLIDHRGEAFSVQYCIQSIIFDLYCFNTSYIVNPITVGNLTLPSIVDDMRTAVNLFTTADKGELILNIITLLIVAFIVAALSISGLGGKFAAGLGMLMLIGGAFLGTFNMLIALLLNFVYFGGLIVVEVIE